MEDLSFLKSALKLARISFSENEPLALKSTFKVGSTCSLYITPSSLQEFRNTVSAAKSQESQYFILGGGSNVVFPDTNYDGIIISTQQLKKISILEEKKSDINTNEVLVSCECGTPMSSFVNFCTSHNLWGAQEFAGLPGSVGGATFMNARCFGKSISEIIYSTEHFELLPHGKTNLLLQKMDISQWDYKKSPFQKENRYITTTTFKLLKGESKSLSEKELENECKKYINERVEKGHFKFPSAGSVFKNNRTFGKPTGQLIEEIGLKGTKIGGAQIAPFHGNFIINLGKATAKDIQSLVNICQKRIQEEFGYNLETEIIFI